MISILISLGPLLVANSLQVKRLEVNKKSKKRLRKAKLRQGLAQQKIISDTEAGPILPRNIARVLVIKIV